VGELGPVAVRALRDDFSLLQQALEKEVDFEFLVLGVDDADGDFLEIDEQRNLSLDIVHTPRGRRHAVIFGRFLEGWSSRHLRDGFGRRECITPGRRPIDANNRPVCLNPSGGYHYARLKRYLTLARPFTLLPPLLGIISGAICAWGSAHNPDA